jgi:hypothetical protein
MCQGEVVGAFPVASGIEHLKGVDLFTGRGSTQMQHGPTCSLAEPGWRGE